MAYYSGLLNFASETSCVCSHVLQYPAVFGPYCKGAHKGHCNARCGLCIRPKGISGQPETERLLEVKGVE